jgi:hypothetical protein
MQEWKAPPIAKIYEALGAVADERVTGRNGQKAAVMSSSGDKEYTVEWGNDFEWITSNDNASYWQGYIGYPIVAVLINEGVLKFDAKAAEFLKGVPWKKLNTKNKNNFAKTIDDVLTDVRSKGGDVDGIISECQRIAAEVMKLNLKRPGKKRPPPKSTLSPGQQTLI